jgi:hypothetical protein
MLIEATRLIKAQLADPTAGINALLPAVPRDAMDTEPPIVDLYAWCDDAWADKWEIPADVLKRDRGALVLKLASDVIPLAIPGNTEMRAQSPELAIAILYARLLDARVADTSVFTRDCSYTLRCVERCLHKWIESTRTEANAPSRLKNQCHLSEVRDLAHAVYTPEVAGYVGHALIVDVRMVDRWATYITPDA